MSMAYSKASCFTKWRLALLFGFTIPAFTAFGQGVLMGPTDTPPHSSALLHLDVNPLPADNKKGVLPPHVALTRTDEPGPVGPLPLPPSLLVYNTARTNLPGALAQFNVAPGFYSWDGSRWLRFEAGVGRQLYVDCSDGTLSGSVSGGVIGGIPSGVWNGTPSFATNSNRIGGLYAAGNQIPLVAGDRVFLEASGAIELVGTGLGEDRFTDVELQLCYIRNTTNMNSANVTVLASTIVSLDTRSTGSTGSSFLFGLVSSSSSGYSQYASIQSWSLMAHLDVTVTDPNYRFFVRARRLKADIGNGRLVTGTPGTMLEGCLRTEIFRY